MTELAASPTPAAARRTHSPLRAVLRRTAQGIVGLALAWLMLEILLRVGFNALPPSVRGAIEGVRRVPWSDQAIIPPPPFTPDGDYQKALLPDLHGRVMYFADGHFTLNTITLWGGRVGLRSDPPAWPVDIAAVGDSFTVCFTELADCWVERLHHDQGWSVMNLGQIATGSLAHLQMLKTFGVPLKPRVVLWQWYGNDFNEDYGFAVQHGETPLLEAPPPQDSAPDFGPLARYSALYAALRRALYDSGHPPAAHLIRVAGQRVQVGDAYSRYSHDLARPGNAYGFTRTVEALDEAQRLTRDAIGGTLVIVLIPAKEEVYGDAALAVLGADELARVSEGHRRMRDLCAQRGWICIDPTADLQRAALDGQPVYYTLDSHLSPTGNRLLAQIVGAALIERGLLPPAP